MKWRYLYSNLPLRLKLLYGYIGAFLLAIVLGNTLLYSVVRNTIEQNIESELYVSTRGILNMVKTAVDTAIRSHLRGLSDAGLQIAQHHYKRYLAGEITEQEAKEETAKDLLSLSIGKTGYIYCVDSKGVIQVHPKPALRGKNLSEHDFIHIQKEQRSGYIEYDWANPGESQTRAKALYMSYFGPWDWIISVSSYRDEFRELLSLGDFRERILSITFGKTGYPYVMDSQGNLIIHPKLEGTNIMDSQDSSGRMFIREICERKDGKIVYPWRNPGEPRSREKLVIFNYIPEMDWIVASSSYLEEFYAPLRTITYTTLTTVVLMLLFVVPVTWRFSTSITAPLHAIMQRFARGAEGDFSGRLETSDGGEVGQLAEYYNNFMERLESSHAQLEKSEEDYRGLFENAAEGIFRASIGGTFLSVNPSLAAMLGYPNPEALMRDKKVQGRRLLAGEAVSESVLDILTKKERLRGLEVCFSRSDNKDMWLSIDAQVLRNNDGYIDHIEGFVSDISTRKQSEEEQRRTRANLERRVIERTAELSSHVRELEQNNAESALLREMGEMLQVCRHERETVPIMGRYLPRFFPDDKVTLYTQKSEDPDLFLAVVSNVNNATAGSSPVDRDKCWALRQGKPYFMNGLDKGIYCPHFAESLSQGPEHGSLCLPMMAQEELTGLLTIEFGIPPKPESGSSAPVSLHALIERKRRLGETIAEHLALALSNLKLRESLRLQSLQDPLTGLYNRRYLEEAMSRETSRIQRQGTSHGVIMADLDHFKRINDTYGHEAGDAVLRAFGGLLLSQTRDEDIACRFGGEEFAIILIDASFEALQAKAEKLCDAARNTVVRHDRKNINFTVSMGIALCPENGKTMDEVLQAADAALYRAKEGGRDRVAV